MGYGSTMPRTLAASLSALATVVVLGAVMLPLRDRLSIATTALVLVIPVVVGVAAGGFTAGLISVLAGFLVYDYFFIRPYYTLAVGATQNWVALAVYVVVMLIVARLVAGLNAAQREAQRQNREIRELFALSELLVADKPLSALLDAITAALTDIFSCRQVALLLPVENELRVVAQRGEALSDTQLARLVAPGGAPNSLATSSDDATGLLVIALSAAGRPIGLLALSSEPSARHDRDALMLVANHIALAVERGQLRDHALQQRLASEVARHAKTLVSAVAHDLRAPLSSIMASASTLVDSGADLHLATTVELASLIDVQSRRLADLVQNLLDMSRVQSGVLEPRYSIVALDDLVDAVLDDLRARHRDHLVDVALPSSLPPVDVDAVLMTRVLSNLVDNALRHSPRGERIGLAAHARGDGLVEVTVSDRGPGVELERRREIFELFARREADAGAGLGLTIAKTFVDAHAQRIWVDDHPGGGAVFHVTLAAAQVEEGPSGERPHR